MVKTMDLKMDLKNESTSTVSLERTGSVKYTDNADFEAVPQNAQKKFDLSEQGGLLFVVIIAVALVLIVSERLFSCKGSIFTSSQSPLVASGEKQKEENEEPLEKPTGLDLAKTFTQAQDSIQEELEQIRQEAGLPDQVFQRTIHPDENVAALITKEFSSFDQDSYQQLRSCISTQGPWFADWEALQTQEVLTRFEPQRERLREMLDNPEAKFEQDLIGTNIGLVPDDQNIDSSWVYLTLEECEVARCLHEKDIDGAVEALKAMLRFADLASQTQFAEMRIHAAYMRENTLRILQVLALDPKFTSRHAEAVFRVLHQTLRNWPSDAKCWIGDRAESLRRFELIRQGRISEALTGDELETLRSLDVLGFKISGESGQTRRERGLSMLDTVAFYKPKSSDKDQDYYLQAMRTLIDSCSQPFYVRLGTLNRVADNLQSQQGKKDYPALSMMFLRGIRESMQTQAKDKARVEAWYLALATLLKHNVREGSVDPVRGKPYVITRVQTPEGSRIRVTYGGNDGKVEVVERS